MTTLLLRSPLRATSLIQRASNPSTTLHRLPSAIITPIHTSTHLPRYTSTSTSTPTTTHTKSLSEKPTKPDPLNPPLSTLPASLTLPIRDPKSSLFTHLFRLGRTYGTFYKTGVKNIYHNARAYQGLQTLIDTQYSHSYGVAIKARGLTRSEYQLLHRAWHDLKRAPGFGLMFLLCGEFTPLFVLLFSRIIPYTCRIPAQILADRKKAESRRLISFRYLTSSLPSPSPPIILNRQQNLHISNSLGLSSKLWDWVNPGQLPGPPDIFLKKRVEKRVEYLRLDDTLLLEAGSEIRNLKEEEVKIALVERGVDVLSKSDEELRGLLEAWLGSRRKGEGSVERLLLMRPSVWPIPPKPLSKKVKEI